MSKLFDGIRALWKHLNAVMVGAFGLLLIFAWAIMPVPHRDQLTEVIGVLESYSVEADQSLIQRSAKHRNLYVLFKVADHAGRFWNGAVGPANVRTIFTHPGVRLDFYAPPRDWFHPINGDAEKTYGLSVDGAEISSLDEALGSDNFVVHFVFPPLGVLSLVLAVFLWKKKTCATRAINF